MTIEISQNDLLLLAAGRRGDLPIGHICFEARKFFGTSRDIVYLSTQSMRHIRAKHGDHVDLATLQMIPLLLQKGMWIAEKSTRKNANFCGVSCKLSEATPRYFVSLKYTRDLTRAYVRTLHKSAPRQTKQKIKRGKVIRDHWV